MQRYITQFHLEKRFPPLTSGPTDLQNKILEHKHLKEKKKHKHTKKISTLNQRPSSYFQRFEASHY